MTPVKSVWLAATFALGLTTACSDNRSGHRDEGDLPDAAGDVGGGDASVTARASVTGFGLSSGGGRLQSERFAAVVVVAGPSPAVALESPRFDVRIGVGIPQVQPRTVSEGGER